jgi:hypothetical protein
MTIGERVAFYQRRRGLTQTVLAGLVGRTEDWLRKVEHNVLPLDRLSVLSRRAFALDVSLGTAAPVPCPLPPSATADFHTSPSGSGPTRPSSSVSNACTCQVRWFTADELACDPDVADDVRAQAVAPLGTSASPPSSWPGYKLADGTRWRTCVAEANVEWPGTAPGCEPGSSGRFMSLGLRFTSRGKGWRASRRPRVVKGQCWLGRRTRPPCIP